MIVIPDDARRTLYSQQQACSILGFCYVTHAWKSRYPDPAPTSMGAWPYKSASSEIISNVTQLKRGKK